MLSGAMILAHDHCRSLKADTYIGKNCVIGVRSIIMPGLYVGNQVVIGGGSVVTKIFIRIVLQQEILQRY